MKRTSNISLFLLFLFLITSSAHSKVRVYDMNSLKKGDKNNNSSLVNKMIVKIKKDYKTGDSVIIRIPKGEYHFHETGSEKCEYYISNHDQDNPKNVGINLDGLKSIMFDGNGSKFIFHGRMLPIALLNSDNCTLRNFSIDFSDPHISQIEVVNVDSQNGMTFKVEPWVKCRINNDTIFETYAEGWHALQHTGMAFERDTRRVVYNTSDLYFSTKGVKRVGDDLYNAPLWKDQRLIPGTKIAMRTWYRPAPGLFLHKNNNTKLENVTVHYAEGMGLLAQLCENITLDVFNVSLDGTKNQRYFTTQADATHFSGCKGTIVSKNGLYENMMDDAINVHGTYLKVVKRIDDKTLVGRYMHEQSWGFDWGFEGDEVQFIRSSTMDLIGEKNEIVSIKPFDKNEVKGAKEFSITFKNDIDKAINEESGFGIENLTWTPKVIFTNNIIRNNRARGALFSTPKDVLVENNIFDHTSGTAILLCGDCNGWYETGACKNVVIRKNRFRNALTNMFQFTNAIISIYPEIPDLDGQSKYFHGGKDGGIVIENNYFDTFDSPILYAKSVDGLTFRANVILKNKDYKPLHWNKSRFLFERVTNVKIEEE